MSFSDDELIDEYLNGNLNEKTFAELEKRLINDPEFALLYAEKTRFNTHLNEIVLDVSDEKKWSEKFVQHEKKQKPSYIVYKIAAQLVVAIGLIAYVISVMVSEDQMSLRKSVGAKFETSSPEIGPLEMNQIYDLKEGFISLDYNDKMEVIIEAPAQFKSIEANHLWIEKGKITASIPDEVKDFTIETKDGKIKDAHASFALNVSLDNSELHVFEGQINLNQSNSKKSLTVNRGQAAVLKSQESEYRPFRNAWFVHSKEFHQLSQGWNPKRRDAWINSVEDWALNPHLLATYKIEKNKGQFLHTDVVHGAKWVQGRWPGTWALDFSEENDHVEIQAKGKTDQFTMMAWMRLDHQPRLYNSIYHTHDWETDGQVHWMVIDGKHMLLGIHGNSLAEKEKGEKARWDHAQSVLISNPYGRWVHLAVTYDKQKKLTRFFVDGKFTNESKLDVAHTAIFDRGQIGNWNSRKFGGSRQLSGRLDEFMIYTTVIGDQQIKRHFEVGNPYNSNVN